MNETYLSALSTYVADYVNEEKDRGNTIDKYTISNAIDAFEGGAMGGHFMFMNVGEWRTCTIDGLSAMSKYFDKQGMKYAVWWIPLEEDAPYSIECYNPVVEGAVLLNVVKVET